MTTFTLPPARLIMGSVYNPNTTDMQGNPLIVKSGPNAGQPRTEYFVGLAIPKTAGHTHFSQTDWGMTIYQVGAAAFPQAYQSPRFSWKVIDGDSTEVNEGGNRPCDREGAKGHWILRLSGGYAPRLYRRNDAGIPVPQPSGRDVPEGERWLKAGYWVEAQVTVESNGNSQKPGVYLNHSLICFAGFDKEIVLGPDATKVFGQKPAALPPGVSNTPVSGPAMPLAPPVASATRPQAPAPTVAAPSAPVPPAAPVAVAPHPGILAPAVAPPPPAAPVRRMTAAAQASYEDYLKSGWTDALLVQHGLMEPA